MACSESKGILYSYDLPRNCVNLTKNFFVVFNNFNGFQRVHIREYVSYGRAELYPTKKGIVLQLHEWRYLCKIFKGVYRNYKSPAANEDYMKDIPTSKDGISVNIISARRPGTFNFVISKKVTTKAGECLSYEITLDATQSENIALKCMKITGMFIEFIISSKLNMQCESPSTNELFRENSLTVSELNKTFKSVFMDELHKDLCHFMCTDFDELIDVLLKIDVLKVLNETLKFYPEEKMYHDKISLEGYVKTMVDKFVLKDDLMIDELEHF